ncbi:lipoprotein [Rhizobium sp. AQ_MP]|uniref:LPS translocon maturation chaperone LptM n=1 Tax=Rhizobium sp. AQ_MP TaxID=2761536 RepID=UPI00163A590C|nr:lipoprotein [Rhizobium sp. AQ_MP]MBC2772749.1 lipoprotein [Rhizobium sp. AQ_MP]
MVNSLKRTTLTLSLLLAASLALSACGRKGDLDPPSTPVDQQNKRDAPVEKTPDTPFVLDPLL